MARLRVYKADESLDHTRGFVGRCRHCQREVELTRTATGEVLPRGRCQRCGQCYYVAASDVVAWRAEQTQQAKALAALRRHAPR